MAPVGASILLIIAGVLIWAGLEKFRTQREFTSTLSALGVPAPLLRALGIGLPSAEILTGVSVVVGPSAAWPRIAVLSLALCFGAAGVLGLRAEEPIKCSCFGNEAHRSLGWFQIGTLPLWFLAMVPVVVSRPHWQFLDSMRNLVGVTLTISLIRALSLTRLRRVATSDRHAFKPSIEPMPIFARVLEGGK